MPASVIETLSSLGLETGMVEGYERFLETLNHPPGVPDRVVALCRLGVAVLHGNLDEWREGRGDDGLEPEAVDAVISGDLGGLAESERAALALVRRVPLRWHQLTDQEVDRVKEHFGEQGCVGLLTAIAFFDVNDRLRATLADPKEH